TKVDLQKEPFAFNPYFEHHLFHYIYPTIPNEYYINANNPHHQPSQHQIAQQQASANRRRSVISFLVGDHADDKKDLDKKGGKGDKPANPPVMNDFIPPPPAPARRQITKNYP